VTAQLHFWAKSHVEEEQILLWERVCAKWESELGRELRQHHTAALFWLKPSWTAKFMVLANA
jgi:hypothetical protein